MDRDEWDRRYGTDEFVWQVEPNRFVAAELDGQRPGRALDLACGEGRNAVWLAEQGWSVTAVDFSEVAIDKGRRLAEARGVEVDFRVDDVTAWSPEPQAYDLVLVCYLQLPAPERRTVLAHGVAALAPGGTVLFVAHDRSNLDGGYGGPQHPDVLSAPDEVADELVAVAGEDSLVIERAEVVQRPVEVDGETRVALDTLVRGHRR